MFQRLSALIWFWSVCLLRIEKRFETWGVEPGFISFDLKSNYEALQVLAPITTLLLQGLPGRSTRA